MNSSKLRGCARRAAPCGADASMMPSAQQSFTGALPFAAVSVAIRGGRRARCAVARLDRAHDAFLDHLRRQAVQRALERIARVDVLAVDPRLAILPVDVVAEQHLVELVHVRVVGEHDVAGVIEREALRLRSTGTSRRRVVLLDQNGVLAQVIRRAETRWARRRSRSSAHGRSAALADARARLAISSLHRAAPWCPTTCWPRTLAHRLLPCARAPSCPAARALLAGRDELLGRAAQITRCRRTAPRRP